MTEKEWRTKFSSKLLTMLEERNMTQTDLTHQLCTCRQQINKFVNAHATPSIRTLLKMCDIFNCTMSELTDMENYKPKKVKKQVTYFKISNLFRGAVFNEATLSTIPGTPLMDENRNRIGVIESIDLANDKVKVVFDDTPIAKKFISDCKERKRRGIEICKEWKGVI